MPPNPLFGSHPRVFAPWHYVYPVLSRRAGGISIGINLNRDKSCNFDCVYCQVDRTTPAEEEAFDVRRLSGELDAAVEHYVSGALFEEPPFNETPAALRRLNDIALSGDGEPTAHPHFYEAVSAAADIRRRCGLDAVKLVLITNASLLDQEPVQRGLEILDRNGGEIWAKLDAGTDAYYRQVARSAVPFPQILKNLRLTARQRPIVIQSLFPRLHGIPPPAEEIEAYSERLCEILASDGKIQGVQVHTVVRPPAERWATPLANAELDHIAEMVHAQTGLPVTAHYGLSFSERK